MLDRNHIHGASASSSEDNAPCLKVSSTDEMYINNLLPDKLLDQQNSAYVGSEDAYSLCRKEIFSCRKHNQSADSAISSFNYTTKAMKHASVLEERTHIVPSLDGQKDLLTVNTCLSNNENFHHQDLPEISWRNISLGDHNILSENEELNRMIMFTSTNQNEDLKNKVNKFKDMFEMERNALVKEKDDLENVLIHSKSSLEGVQKNILELERVKLSLEMEINNRRNALEKTSLELFNLKKEMDALEFDHSSWTTVLEEAEKHASLLDRERHNLMLELENHQKTFEKAYWDYIVLEKEKDKLQCNLNESKSNINMVSRKTMNTKSEKRYVEEASNIPIVEFEKSEEHDFAQYEALKLEKEQEMVSIEKELNEKRSDDLLKGNSTKDVIMEEMERKDNVDEQLKKELRIVKIEQEDIMRMLKDETSKKREGIEKLNVEKGRNGALDVFFESAKLEKSGLIVEIENEKMTKGATLEEMKAMEDHIGSLENGLKETKTEAIIHDGEREEHDVFTTRTYRNIGDAEFLSTNADKKFDVKESLREDDKCLVAFLDESLSFKNLPLSTSNAASNIGIEKEMLTRMRPSFSAHRRNVPEMASLLVELKVLKQIATSTSDALNVKKAHVLPLSTTTLCTSALAALGLFLTFLKFRGHIHALYS